VRPVDILWVVRRAASSSRHLTASSTRDGWIAALYFVDQRTGFAYRATEAGGVTVLLKTIDGGVTWMDVGRFN
jgi:photosystem II stability/assembly factor-like uncharacterized protein